MSTVARHLLTRPPRPSTLPQAAPKVIEDLRRSGPSTWKELWRAGLGDSVLPPSPPPQPLPGQSKSRKANAHLRSSMLGSAPEDHPFRSVTHFKKHILKNLAQQGLIEQVHIARPSSTSATTFPSSSSSSSSSSPDSLQGLRKTLVQQKQLSKHVKDSVPVPKEKAQGHQVSEFLWTLPRALAASESTLSADPGLKAQRERLEADLRRLVSAENNHDLVRIGRARTERLAAEAASRREHQVARRAVLPGTKGERAYRTGDEMMAWEGRKEYLTVEKERDHLNKRRGLARPVKERKAQSWLDELNEAREEARDFKQ